MLIGQKMSKMAYFIILKKNNKKWFCIQIRDLYQFSSKCWLAKCWLTHHDILNPPQLRLTSRKPLWCVMTPTDIKSQWRESWKSAPVVNAHLVDDPTIRQPGFTLPQQQWSLLNRFRTGQGHCGVLQTLICLLWRDPNDAPHRWICKAERWSVPASLCCCCCYCLADQLWVLIAYARRRRKWCRAVATLQDLTKLSVIPIELLLICVQCLFRMQLRHKWVIDS